jgi:hypothetical protein
MDELELRMGLQMVLDQWPEDLDQVQFLETHKTPHEDKRNKTGRTRAKQKK